MENDDWKDVKTDPPKLFGWYAIKTPYGEYEAPFVNTAAGNLVWVLPDESIITHWKERVNKIY